MPKKHKNDEYGDLYIQFRVEMPKPNNNKKGGSPLTKEELTELSRLLSKLESGTIPTKRKSKTKQEPDEGTTICSLQQATIRDFGRASGQVQLDEDEYSHHHHDPHSHPFAGSQFFSNGSSSGGFYFGGNFGGHPFGGGGQDDGDVQCTQM